MARRSHSRPSADIFHDTSRPDFLALCLECSAMRTYTTGKGKKKAVKAFTTRQGLWMLALMVAVLLGILALWLLGFLNFDMD
jgi:hypothetical protein